MPTSGWKMDKYAIDKHELRSLAGTPPGDYHLRVGVYRLTESGIGPLEVLTDGLPAGLEYDLGVVTVTRGAPQTPGPLRLVDSSLAVQTAAVGDRVPFTIAFVSGDTISSGMVAELRLIDSNGQSIFSTSFPPAGSDYTSDQWTPNELIRYPHAVDLPPDLSPGPAHVILLFRHADGSPASESFDLGAITITAPERSFAIPPMARHIDYDFGGAIRLLGYDLTPEAITLYWQSLQPVTKRYTVFIHRLDEAGAFISGSDAPPPRPTTSWLPGEVITDAHQFAVDGWFEIGLYDPVTGERLGEPFLATTNN